MSHFWQAFWGKWAGGITVALAIALSAVFGVGPDTWAAWLLDGLPVWVTPARARITILILAVFVFLHMFIAPLIRAVMARRDRRDMDGNEAINWITNESVWGWFSYLRWNSLSFVRDFAYDEFREQAQDGKIEVRAYQNINLDRITLERDYWRTARLDHEDMNAGRTVGGRTTIDNTSSHIPPVGGLLIEQRQVTKTWPRAPLWIRPPIRAIVRLRHARDRIRRRWLHCKEGADE